MGKSRIALLRQKRNELKDRLRKNTQGEESNQMEFRKNYQTSCVVCGSTPTVGDMELCGPCCFGEAETIGGNW